MSNRDDILLNRIKDKSDDKAFEYVFHAYYAPLCEFAYSILQNHSEAEDVVSDCFFEFWNKREVITIKTSLKSYLHVSVKNSALNHLKKQKRRKKYASDLMDQNNYPFLQNDDVNEQIEKMQQLEEFESRLKNAIEHLPKQCHYIFYLNRYEHMSYKEISQKLNLSTGTVKTQIARALRKIRAEFDETVIKNKILYFLFVRHF